MQTTHTVRRSAIARGWLLFAAALGLIGGCALSPALAQDMEHMGQATPDVGAEHAQHAVDAAVQPHAAAEHAEHSPPAPHATDAHRSYYVYVACESEDEVALVRFDSGGDAAAPAGKLMTRIPVGVLFAEMEGAHGLCVDPSGDYWYLSMAHGQPNGRLYKFDTVENGVVGYVELGMFPATMQVSPATGLLYIVNFDLHGGNEVSTVSVVDPVEMLEVARIPTGIMPHGSRLSPDGLRQYSVAMMSDTLYEIDAVNLKLRRKLKLTVEPAPGEMVMHGDHTHGEAQAGETASSAGAGDHAHEAATGSASAPVEAHAHVAESTGGASGTHASESPPTTEAPPTTPAQDIAAMHAQHMAHDQMTMPTWVQLHPTKPLAYVACNGADQIQEIDVESWRVTRRLPTSGQAPYNVEVTPDGTRLVATYKKSAQIAIWDIAAGKELAVLPTTRKVAHGIAITPDNRFAIVTSEGIGAEPGAVDLFDLEKRARVATVDTPKQASGIAFWKMEELREDQSDTR